ncbi:hypothetical protein PROQFM164_S01g000484 [Penicillium roqueforti FM164]|uniref:Uncharacterized protein n=1 Tax=Penicillium roqueforti (strain FM164) TaxID=1365484 RepID=W6PS29_PENRF|nr:hypothetical protein PROQFM164_S01g000484 [Penicillium roqueforti FM164]
MTSNLQHANSTLPDEIQHIRSPATRDDRCDDCPPSLSVGSKLCSSFSLRCSLDPNPETKDPFGRLPWFGLEELLLHLPDLPTLHQLCQASPAVSDYLNHKIGFFPKLVERIIDQWDHERGLSEDTRVFFRTLVYLWWKEESVASGIPSDDNPLPVSFHDELVYSINIAREGFSEPIKVGCIRLPHSTPPKILRYLLSLTSRIRGDAHAFFHDAMTLCLSADIQKLENRKSPWPKNGTRPPGIPVHIGTREGGYPPTWLEEQRLMQAFLKPYIFSVLRRIVCEKRLLNTNSPPPGTKFPHTLMYLQGNLLIDFWRTFACYGWMRTEPIEQLETVLSWMHENKSRKRAANFTICCPKFTSLSDCQRSRGLDNLQHIHLPGCFFAQNCSAVPQSGVKIAGFRGEFQRFGVSFWDNERMLWLGLALPRMDRYLERKDLAFRWSSLLLSANRDATKSTGKTNGLRFRNKTKPISIGNKVLTHGTSEVCKAIS